MNAVKHLILGAVASDELRAALEPIPGAYFQVARETAADPDDVDEVLWRLVEVYRTAVTQLRWRADALEARLAEQRRRHLCLVEPDPQQRSVTP